MASAEELHGAACRLPGVEEGTHFGMTAYTVDGKGFASLTKDGWLQLRFPPDTVDDLLAAHPAAEALSRGDTSIGIRVRLAELSSTDMVALLHASSRIR
ncbi:MmcQ/YjbR family DNA-binding protein [Janibacter cremeus]|uniref:MmcQ/YjbR family DNA-binding protein n=1 Tax=Janibacter cremeus TaxID=1285192 RepID=UPI0023F7D8FF|nr:MmcQ/YjbR family DNA-binding protein [Janibacter cremeus]WEV78356.1 MmcQ/YjbR family DNA-binding protein [Janibacter cremeus]